MSNDVQKIKIKLNEKYLKASATNSSSCNDFFANCCNCCDNKDDCCCECLDGFFITITGMTSVECGCGGFNISRVFIPIKGYGLDGIPEDEIPRVVLPAGIECIQYSEWTQVSTYACFDGFQVRDSVIEVIWILYCIDNKLYLKVIQDGYENITAGTSAAVNIVWQFEPANCNDLKQSGGPGTCMEIEAFYEFCNCHNMNITLEPKYGGPNFPPECNCCRSEGRCEASEPNCLNPYPDTLTFNVNDNCAGPSTIILSRIDFGGPDSLCWIGNYNVVCIECEFGYTIGVMLCCNGGNWSLFFFPSNNFDSIVWDNIFEGYGTEPGSASLMYIDNCDPLLFHSDNGFCKTKVVNCPGPTAGAYCVFSFTITE